MANQPDRIQLKGSTHLYKVLHMTNENRAIVFYDGDIPVCVDRDSDGVWDLSGQPAEGEEKNVIAKYSPAMNTTEVTSTHPREYDEEANDGNGETKGD